MSDVEALRSAVVLAVGAFESYARQHHAKDTPEGYAKARANQRLADVMRAALAPPSVDSITQRLTTELLSRSAVGMRKYGISVADAPLNRRQWLQHAKEEALDLAVYLQKLIDAEDEV